MQDLLWWRRRFRLRSWTARSTLTRLDTLLDNPPVEQMDGPVGELRVARIVRHHADGRPPLVQLAQQFMTASPLAESRLPVGSSASRINGSPLRARAPPPAAAGRRKAATGNASCGATSPRAPAPLAPAACAPPTACRGSVSGSSTFFINGEVADQVERLEMKPISRLRMRARSGELESRHRLPIQVVGAVGGRVQQPRMASSVDLPQPEGHRSTGTLPFSRHRCGSPTARAFPPRRSQKLCSHSPVEAAVVNHYPSSFTPSTKRRKN